MRTINGNSDIVGYRFHPTDKELVDHYLWNKILDRDSLVQAIKEVDGLFNKDPWELPGYSEIKSDDQVWYFFSRRKDNKRVKRTTDKGFWKVTGKARNVKGKRGSAVKKTLVFYEGRTPSAKWTPWVIHEYTFTSTVLDNKEGIFLCKLKNKEDEKANTSSSESCQPSQVADDEIPENSTMFNPDEMLATLEEPDGRHEAENDFSLAKQPLMHEDQLPSCEEFTHFYDFSDFYGVQHLSNSEEQNDESWTKYLVDDNELYADETSNEQVFGNEGCNLPLVGTSMTCPGESSRKRSRSEDGVLCGAIESEECQAMYEQVVSASMMLDEHTRSKKFQALAMVNAPTVTLTAVEHDPHGRESMLSVRNESREMDAPSVDSAVDLHCIVRVALAEGLDYSIATRFHNPHYQKERSQKLIEQEDDDPKRITKQGTFSGKIVSQDKAIDVKQHATTVNLPQKENAVMESNRKWKTAEKNYGNTRLQMRLNESADSDKKGFFICIDKPSLNHKSSRPSVYFVNALVGIVLVTSVIYELISVAIGPRSY